SIVFYSLFGYASVVESLPLLFAARIGAGICGATIGIAQAAIADSTTPEKRTRGMALIGAAFGIGFTFGPMIGAGALAFDDWMHPGDVERISPLPGYLAAVVSAGAFLLAVALLPETRKFTAGHSADAGHDHRHRGVFELARLRVALSKPTVGFLIFAFFLAVVAFAEFEGTLSLVADESFGLSPRGTGLVIGYIGVVLTIAQGFVVRRLAKSIADVTLCRLGVAMMILGMAGSATAIVAQSLLLFLLVQPILVTGFALMNSASQGMISRRTRAEDQGAVLGVNQSAAAMSRILGPIIGAVLFDRAMDLPYWTGAALLVVPLVAFLRLPKAPDAPQNQSAAMPSEPESV
ncbi:MAG: MFS transporter, partial [Planctomycetia bacterium]